MKNKQIDSDNMSKARKRIIVAIDQSDTADHVMSSASELAESLNADVIVLSVIEIPSLASEGELDFAQIENEEKRIYEYHKKLIDKYFSGSAMLIESKILHGNAADKICEFAKNQNTSVVIIGTSGMGKLEAKLLGSVSEKVIKNCSCNVMIVRK